LEDWVINSSEFIPTVPKTFSGYLSGGANPTTELNTLFHYFDTGVFVYTKTQPITPMLHIDKGGKHIQIGDYVSNQPETNLYFGCNNLYLKSASNTIPISLGVINLIFNILQLK
jgi:hypothetical protein